MVSFLTTTTIDSNYRNYIEATRTRALRDERKKGHSLSFVAIVHNRTIISISKSDC